MEKRVLTCIRCPLGCQITVTMDQGVVVDVIGNTCPRGEEYVKKEIFAPTRIVTSTVRLEGGCIAALPVKTKSDIPKDKIFDIMEELKNVVVKAPVQIGDIVVDNVAETGVPVIAVKDIN